ncbi:MAG: manganese efflux pump MntP family protein, partial [Lachnospiraceae bacterium]|nr:manganese efflux pump MntP family protein [bacterium]MDY5516123.1 manganese efflux pump MntP family protein [Lachnospiraceae bacterium]
MSIWLELVLQSIALGVALAMDAFSVSMANGLNDPGMEKKKMCVIAGTFAGFQFAMPMIGWFCVTTIKEIFAMFEKFIPWIALLLLLFIGGKMLLDGIRGGDDGEESSGELGVKLLIVQGIATSIDALSTGFTTSAYSAFQAFISSLIIAVVTFVICIAGVKMGKKFGVRLAEKAQILGGVILILIGLKICFIG